MPKAFLIFAFLSFSLIASSVYAQQAAVVNESIETVRWKGKIEQVKAYSKEGIPFLSWKSDQVVVESTFALHYTNVLGQFKEKVLQATLNSKPIPVKEDGSFDIQFGFPGEEKTFTITAIDANNKIYRMMYRIQQIAGNKPLPQEKQSRWRFSAGLGYTTLSYQQTNVTPFNETAITVKGGATYRLVPNRWDLGVSAFFNALVLNSTSPSTRQDKIQYLGINGRASYNLIRAPKAFRMNVNGGIYFNTSFSSTVAVSNDPPGFSGMIGPQLYPEFIYVFKNGNSLMLYGKYSPSFEFKSNEVATGLHYSFPINRANRLSIGIDIATLNLAGEDPLNPGTTLTASTSTMSFGAGISF